MQHSLAHGEQFTRMKVRISPSEFKRLIAVGVFYHESAVYRRNNDLITCLHPRKLMASVQGRSEDVSRLTNGWYIVELERTTLLFKDENHQWLKYLLSCVQDALTSQEITIPPEYREIFISPEDIFYRRKGRIKVQWWNGLPIARYYITRADQIRAEFQDRVDYHSIALPPLPVASEQTINKLVDFYQGQHA